MQSFLLLRLLLWITPALFSPSANGIVRGSHATLAARDGEKKVDVYLVCERKDTARSAIVLDDPVARSWQRFEPVWRTLSGWTIDVRPGSYSEEKRNYAAYSHETELRVRIRDVKLRGITNILVKGGEALVRSDTPWDYLRLTLKSLTAKSYISAEQANDALASLREEAKARAKELEDERATQSRTKDFGLWRGASSSGSTSGGLREPLLDD